jgi:uncharacterized damage-inducible protein DinB
MKKYRKNGAVGALLDEYEKALHELIRLLNSVSNQELVTTVDHQTDDPDCVSIRSVLTHVIRAGYNYATVIKKSQEDELDYKKSETFETVSEYQDALTKMFTYNESLFAAYPNLKLEETNPKKKITTSWGQQYDVEQLYEHAVVHILRHRRQIERFLIKLR